jgi:nicotinamide-nucleotide amidase
VVAVHKTGVDLGVIDHGSIVWDEIVPFWLVLLFCPTHWLWQTTAFCLFRFFDITKPQPARYFDEKVKSGLGVMCDDLVAAGYTLAGSGHPALRPRRCRLCTAGVGHTAFCARMSACDQPALEALAAEVGGLLSANGQHLVTAESCSGGWVAQCLTAIAGSSGWFDRGFVTYSNQAKIEMLGVPAATLATHGAVSEATAAAMALGALRHSHADWALAISGVAGPGGGSPSRPVGTVCFAWAGPEGFVATATCHFDGDRRRVRAQSVAHALTGILQRAGHRLV